MDTFRDWVYSLERTFPHLHGTGTFFLIALIALVLLTGLYFVTRRRTHLLACASIALYLLPFMK